MASLTAKIIRGKTYYYVRECKRVNGKPQDRPYHLSGLG